MTPLGPEFRRQDLLAKHLPGRHVQQRHAGVRAVAGLMRAPGNLRGPDVVDDQPQAERVTRVRTRPVKPNEPRVVAPRALQDQYISTLKMGDEIIVSRMMQTKSGAWVRREENVAYLGRQGDDWLIIARLPHHPGDKAYKIRPVTVVVPGYVAKADLSPEDGTWHEVEMTPEMTEIAKAVRRVRTPDGAEKYGQPIGTIITADMVRRAARQAARAGKGGGAGPRKRAARPQAAQGRDKAPDGPSGDRFTGRGDLPTDPVQRKQTYQRAIRAARGDEDALARVVMRLETDSILDTSDYDDLLDQIAAAAELPPPPPRKPAKKAAAKKPPVKKPDAPRPDDLEVPPQRTGPNTRAAREREAAAKRAEARRAAAKAGNPPGLRQRVRSVIDQVSGRKTRKPGEKLNPDAPSDEMLMRGVDSVGNTRFTRNKKPGATPNNAVVVGKLKEWIDNEQDPDAINQMRRKINNLRRLNLSEKAELDDAISYKLGLIRRKLHIAQGDHVGVLQANGRLFVGRVVGRSARKVRVEGVGRDGLLKREDVGITRVTRLKPANEIAAVRQQMAIQIAEAESHQELDALNLEIRGLDFLTRNERNELYGQIAVKRRELDNPADKVGGNLPGPRFDGEAGVLQAHIKQAQSDRDLEVVYYAINERGFPPDVADALLKQVSARQKQLQERTKAFLANLNVKTQNDHFLGGGGIADAPEDGLWDYIRNDKSGRFTIEANSDHGISENYWVTDNGKDPSEKWMFKRTEITFQDVLWENLAYEVMNRAGFPAPTTKWASGQNRGRDTWMAQRHFLEETSDGKGRIIPGERFRQEADREEWVDGMRRGKDPKVLSRLIIYDYLINNHQDRHQKNILAIDDGGGRKRVGIIDQGFAFGNAEKWNRGNFWNQSLNKFFEDNRYRALDWGIFSLARKVAGGEGALRREFEEALEGFSKVDLEDVEATLKARGLSLSDQEDLDDWLSELAWRRDNLRENMDDLMVIANRMARAGH